MTQTEMKEIFRQGWLEVLNVEEVSDEDDFFNAGGNSIMAVQLPAWLVQKGIKLDIMDIFMSPTFGELAKKLQETDPLYMPEEMITKEVAARAMGFASVEEGEKIERGINAGSKDQQVCTPAEQTKDAQVCTPTGQTNDAQVCTPAEQTNDTQVCTPAEQTNNTQVCTPASQMNNAQVCTPAGQTNDAQVCTPAGQTNDAQVCTPAAQTNDAQVCTPAGQMNISQVCTPASQMNNAQVCTPAAQMNNAQVCTPAGQTNNTQVCTSAGQMNNSQVCTPVQQSFPFFMPVQPGFWFCTPVQQGFPFSVTTQQGFQICTPAQQSAQICTPNTYQGYSAANADNIPDPLKKYFPKAVDKAIEKPNVVKIQEVKLAEKTKSPEQALMDVMVGILPTFNRNKDFFEQGLSSLDSVKMVTRCGEAGYKLELKDIYMHSTFDELLGYLK